MDTNTRQSANGLQRITTEHPLHDTTQDSACDKHTTTTTMKPSTQIFFTTMCLITARLPTMLGHEIEQERTHNNTITNFANLTTSDPGYHELDDNDDDHQDDDDGQAGEGDWMGLDATRHPTTAPAACPKMGAKKSKSHSKRHKKKNKKGGRNRRRGDEA